MVFFIPLTEEVVEAAGAAVEGVAVEVALAAELAEVAAVEVAAMETLGCVSAGSSAISTDLTSFPL